MGNFPEFAGTIGLTFISTLEDWKERPIYTLQLVNGEGLLAISAYTMELMGILVALSILAHFQMITKIYSDCEAAVKSVNNLRVSRKVIKAKSRDASLLTLAAKLLDSQDTEVLWIKGHPEKTHPDAEEWTKNM
jgi:ribonuclease HI